MTKTETTEITLQSAAEVATRFPRLTASSRYYMTSNLEAHGEHTFWTSSATKFHVTLAPPVRLSFYAVALKASRDEISVSKAYRTLKGAARTKAWFREQDHCRVAICRAASGTAAADKATAAWTRYLAA